MPRRLPRIFGNNGLNTSDSPTGMPWTDLVELQDFRVVGDDLVQRLGLFRVDGTADTTNARAMDLDGVNQELSNEIDTRVWALGLKWTIELLIEPDSAAGGSQGILCAGHTTPSIIIDIHSDNNIRVRVWDTDNTLDTISVGASAAEKQSVQVTRDGATLSAKLDNGTAVTATMDATKHLRTPVGDLRIGNDDSGNFLDGTIDHVRVFDGLVRSNHKDRLLRYPTPRARHVLADYDMNATGTLVYDRSRYENHLIVQNAPSEVTPLCHNPSIVRAISMHADENSRKQLLVAAGGKYYIGGVD